MCIRDRSGWKSGSIAQGREDASTGRAPRIGLPRMSSSHAGHSPRAPGSQSKSSHHTHASHSGTNTKSRKNAKSTHRRSKHHGSKGSCR